MGILAPTGTPIDNTLHVSLQGIEAMHMDWQKPRGLNTNNTFKTKKSKEMQSHDNPPRAAAKHAHSPSESHSESHLLPEKSAVPKLQPKSITAMMVGLKSKISTFRLQREINHYKKEPLLAILPGVALSELWQMMTILENTLLLVSYLVLISACLGVSAMLLASMRERTKEIQLLRMIGASPLFLFLFVELEALLVVIVSIGLATGILFCSLVLGKGYLAEHFGLHISTNILSTNSLYLVTLVMIATFVIAMFPSISSALPTKRPTS